MRETLKETLLDFEKFLLVKKGISGITIKGYKGGVKRLLKKTKTLNPSHEQIEDFILRMHEKEYSYSHIVNTSLALEWYTKYKDNPIRLGRPKKPKALIKNILTEAEVSLLIHSATNIREKAIIALLAYSAIRNSELCNLCLCDINLGENTLRVVSGKGKKDRIVNIGGECSNVVFQYLYAFPRKSEEYLFTTLRSHHRLDGHDVRKMIKKVTKRATLNKRVYPHLLRHTWAVHMLKRGASIFFVQKHLGHAFLETTLIYAFMLPSMMQNEYNRCVVSYI
jgi:integrase/recombinase XerD